MDRWPPDGNTGAGFLFQVSKGVMYDENSATNRGANEGEGASETG